MSDSPRKAVALVSGGLDSMLAAKIVQEQGVHVEGVNFFTGFCVEGHTQALRKKDKEKPKRNNALWVAEQLDMPLHIVDIVEEYKDVLINPKHGYGAHLNPCLDCKIFMVNKALQWAQENGFDFIITGEVIGQRPKSQRADTMPIIAKESGAFDRLLRPLSAKNLPATLPEREGWVNRDELYDITGRSRKVQMELAEKFGFDDYAQPAGGCCMLTNEEYSRKLVDMWQHQGDKDYELDDVMLLKVGRHIRPRDNFKMIIGREEGENRFMEGYRKQFAYMYPTSHRGPLTLIDGEVSDEDLELAASLMARFSQGKKADRVTVNVARQGGEERPLEVRPMQPDEVRDEWYV